MFHIIGQGLAGTLIAHLLEERGVDFVVYDIPNPNAATNNAAGLLNPISGRNYAKAWMLDELFPAAFEDYKKLELKLGAKLLYHSPIVRHISDLAIHNDLATRNSSLIAEDFSDEPFIRYFNNSKAYIKICPSGRCDISKLRNLYTEKLTEENKLTNKEFDFNSINPKDTYIFCEGHGVKNNPFFRDLPFAPTKGEMLLVQIDGYPFEEFMVKHDYFVIPVGEEIYWVGSNYEREYSNELPSEESLAEFMADLTNHLPVKPKVVAHKASIRASTRTRQPLIGRHPTHENLFIFNGLGTKGTSFGPYFAKMLIAHIFEGAAIPKGIDVSKINF